MQFSVHLAFSCWACLRFLCKACLPYQTFFNFWIYEVVNNVNIFLSIWHRQNINWHYFILFSSWSQSNQLNSSRLLVLIFIYFSYSLLIFLILGVKLGLSYVFCLLWQNALFFLFFFYNIPSFSIFICFNISISLFLFELTLFCVWVWP